MAHNGIFFTYENMAEIFKVDITTIRNWKHAGDFKIIGYRRIGKWKKEAIVDATEVRNLVYKKYGN